MIFYKQVAPDGAYLNDIAPGGREVFTSVHVWPDEKDDQRTRSRMERRNGSLIKDILPAAKKSYP